MERDLIDIYTDYLLSSFSYTTSTGLSKMLEGAVSHDQITRMLSKKEYTSKELWKYVKKFVRENETEDGVVIIDDTVAEKPHTDENEIINWHYDHSKGTTVKGVNLLSCVYANTKIKVPTAFEIVKKDEWVTDDKGVKRRKSKKTKNELMREMIEQNCKNQVQFKYVVSDSWFSSKENMTFIRKLNKHFVFAIKSNRSLAFCLEDKLKGQFKAINSLELQEGVVYNVYLKGLDFPVLLSKQVFKNENGLEGHFYLVSSDLSLDFTSITTIYQKRWKVEEYHKSIKSNTSLTKSPTRTVKTQSNHVFFSILSFFKMETLSLRKNLNHFACKSFLYINAIKSAFQQLQIVKEQTSFSMTA